MSPYKVYKHILEMIVREMDTRTHLGSVGSSLKLDQSISLMEVEAGAGKCRLIRVSSTPLWVEKGGLKK